MTVTIAVLLVEDESLIALLVSEALEAQGLRVRAVASAESALEEIETGEPADLLLTDINLPGMNGKELARRARALRPELGVIYTSGNPAHVAEEERVPRSVYLAKPYLPQAAYREIIGVLAMRPHSSSLTVS